MLNMPFQRPKFQKFSGGACPRTPLEGSCLRHSPPQYFVKCPPLIAMVKIFANFLHGKKIAIKHLFSKLKNSTLKIFFKSGLNNCFFNLETFNKIKSGVTDLFFESNEITAKKLAILERHGYHSDDSKVIFVRKIALF